MRDASSQMRAFRERFVWRQTRAGLASTERKLSHPGTPQDVSSPRAKSQRHGKVTADRWNQ